MCHRHRTAAPIAPELSWNVGGRLGQGGDENAHLGTSDFRPLDIPGTLQELPQLAVLIERGLPVGRRRRGNPSPASRRRRWPGERFFRRPSFVQAASSARASSISRHRPGTVDSWDRCGKSVASLSRMTTSPAPQFFCFLRAPVGRDHAGQDSLVNRARPASTQFAEGLFCRPSVPRISGPAKGRFFRFGKPSGEYQKTRLTRQR